VELSMTTATLMFAMVWPSMATTDMSWLPSTHTTSAVSDLAPTRTSNHNALPTPGLASPTKTTDGYSRKTPTGQLPLSLTQLLCA
jgi:hypothetical protein